MATSQLAKKKGPVKAEPRAGRSQLDLFGEAAADKARPAAERRAAPAPAAPRSPSPPPPPAPPAPAPGARAPRVTAESLAQKQREISVSEFFVKNRHLLGFDNPSKALPGRWGVKRPGRSSGTTKRFGVN